MAGIGDSVNLASRVQDLTKEYGAPILVTGETKERIEHMCQLRHVDSIQVRGRSQSTDYRDTENRASVEAAAQ